MGSRISGSRISRLPSRFPVGTRYVIEGRGGHVHLRYLEFPDGRQIKLPADRPTQREPRSPLTTGPRRKATSRAAARSL
ncbi:MAG: hypothetical protein V7604_5072 [Hyphomicrobiales bacterium]